MSSKPKLEKDYDEYNQAIERKTQEELKKIRQQIEKAKQQAKQTGENLELILEKEEPQG